MGDIVEIKNTTTDIQVVDYKDVARQWLVNTGTRLNNGQMAQFIDMCCAFKLNPIKREIYAVAYKDNFNIIVGYEVYLKRAERTKLLDGYNVEFLGTGEELRAKITIYRKDWSHPFIHEVYFCEYNTGRALWATKPRTMLRKVAIAQGFRLCFSDELGGMPYTSDELPDIPPNPTVPVIDVQEESKQKVVPDNEQEEDIASKALRCGKQLEQWLVQYARIIPEEIKNRCRDALQDSDAAVINMYEYVRNGLKK